MSEQESNRTDLDGLKVAVLATDGFEQSELLEPMQALRELDAQVDILSLEEGTIQGVQHMKPGSHVQVDHVLKPGMDKEYDAVLLPGGAINADHLRLAPEVKSFLQTFDKVKKPIAAICHAPWELISAGLVQGRRLTSYHTIQDDIRNAGGEWIDQEVIRDGNWVTSRQPSDIPAFNREMIALFAAHSRQMKERQAAIYATR